MTHDASVDHAVGLGRDPLPDLGGAIYADVGPVLVLGLTLFGTLAIAVLFWRILDKFKSRPEQATPASASPGSAPAGDPSVAPPQDEPARRRLLGIMRALDQVRGSGKDKAKRALTRGDTAPAKLVFELAEDKRPIEAARGLALIAEHSGDPETAAKLYARMYETERETLGPRHPQARRGAILYASFLREQRPDSPVLAELEGLYGTTVGT